jgi:hypothetical protein
VHKKPTEQSPDVQQPIVQPMVDEMTKPSKTPQLDEKAPPVGPVHPPKSAELDQDPGGGYNANHVIPQP